MIINIHAGHNPDGMKACGAVGFIQESTEARRVKEITMSYLRKWGHTVYDCTVNDGISQTDVLNKIVKKCNAHEAHLNVSIHFNAGVSAQTSSKRDGKTTGSEVYVYKTGGIAEEVGLMILDEFEELGFRNRGVKVRKNLAVLRRTVDPAILIEVCFVDDPDDVRMYNPCEIGYAIAYCIKAYALCPK